MLHLAVDVGGTFTDICLFDEQGGATRVAKVSSMRDPIDAVFEGIGGMDLAPPYKRRHGVILDWGTGELLPKTTEGFGAMLERRVVPHWNNGPRESRGA